MPRIVVIAGEASGDQLGAGLIAAAKAINPDIEFEGIGGPEMEAVGFTSWFSYERLAVFGLFEVLKHLPDLLDAGKEAKRRILEDPPDLFIGIDAPDFNLRVEKTIRAAGVPVIHYVCPSVWAWRRHRIPRIAKQLDRLLCVFPFEPELYANTGLHCDFIGHPLAADIQFNPDPADARRALDLPMSGPILGILPGSRNAEVKRLLPLFLQVFDRLLDEDPDLIGVIPAASDALTAEIQSKVAGRPCRVVSGQSRQVMAASTAVLLASGTAALESVLTGRPTVAAYRMNPWTYRLVKGKLETEFVTLPNYLAHQALIPELIQDHATTQAIVSAIQPQLKEGVSDLFLAQARSIHETLTGDVTARASRAILDELL